MESDNGTFSGFGLRPDKGVKLIAADDIGAFAELVFLQEPTDDLGIMRVVTVHKQDDLALWMRMWKPDCWSGPTPTPGKSLIIPEGAF